MAKLCLSCIHQGVCPESCTDGIIIEECKYFSSGKRYMIYNNSGSINETISNYYSEGGLRFDRLCDVFTFISDQYHCNKEALILQHYSFDNRIPANVYSVCFRKSSNSSIFLYFLVEV